MAGSPASPDPTSSMGGSSGSSDPTGGVAASWAAQQLNSGQARPDDDKYKKQQPGDSPWGSNPFGSNSSSGGGGGMSMP